MINNVFFMNNQDEFNESINIDELYDRKKKSDLLYLDNYNKILNKIYTRIKSYSKYNKDITSCMFPIPLNIIGVSKFKQSHCIAYLLDKLTVNGFKVKYVYPNLLFISWEHYVPTYVREEIKKRTGIKINEYGEEIIEVDKEEVIEDNKPKTKLKYEPIKKYIATGKFDF
jgi:hypothetical protein